jgi:hypothetical protein
MVYWVYPQRTIRVLQFSNEDIEAFKNQGKEKCKGQNSTAKGITSKRFRNSKITMTQLRGQWDMNRSEDMDS